MPIAIKRALISVSDKAGVVELARALVAHGYTLLSTGGTASALRAARLSVLEVAAVAGQGAVRRAAREVPHPDRPSRGGRNRLHRR